MEQKQRNKIAAILVAVLVPLLLYLLAANIAKVRAKKDRQAPPTAVAGAPLGAAAVASPVQPAINPVASKILAEQKRIAELLPAGNPFNPAPSAGAEPAAVIAVTETPPAAADPGIRLTAIISRGGAGRAAMINGRLYGVGDSIAGWTIINIDAREVRMQTGSRQMTLKLK
jgi:hypothetical protein